MTRFRFVEAEAAQFPVSLLCRVVKPLSGYAMDITIRVNHQGAYFLDDQNSERLAMPHNNREELVDTLRKEIERNHSEHFTP